VETIIFLDVDGVLNAPASAARGDRPDDERLYGLDPAKCRLLGEVVRRARAGLVVSSCWRKFEDYAPWAPGRKWREVLAERAGIPAAAFAGDTPSLPATPFQRGSEIEAWLVSRAGVGPWAVLDDEVGDIVPVLGPGRVVKTDPGEGLTAGERDALLALLGA